MQAYILAQKSRNGERLNELEIIHCQFTDITLKIALHKLLMDGVIRIGFHFFHGIELDEYAQIEAVIDILRSSLRSPDALNADVFGRGSVLHDGSIIAVAGSYSSAMVLRNPSTVEKVGVDRIN